MWFVLHVATRGTPPPHSPGVSLFVCVGYTELCVVSYS
ncbi:hypothetical protein GRAN_2525 [Granulicella sibirica]|uniref:Uncharacterized protein n=1 Tax=Granulicella sibirica TaxID=2479048 RepID=A0A4Q0T134_9BACT|nr:hypothetical protein GRAN_2525 [Granulicella sibirica]